MYWNVLIVSCHSVVDVRLFFNIWTARDYILERFIRLFQYVFILLIHEIC